MTLPAPKLEHWPPEHLDVGYNPRQIVEDDDLARLMEDIRERGIVQPVGALQTKRLLWGGRRHWVAQKLKLKTMPVLVFPGDIAERTILGLTMQENLLHKALSHYETLLGLLKFREACPEMTQAEIAKASGMSPGMASQFFALDKLLPEAMEAFKVGKFGVTKAYEIARSPEQLATLSLFLNGETRESVGRKTRQAKAVPVAPDDKAKRITLPPVGKAAVVIAAGKDAEISLDDALQAVVEAARQIKAAQAKGISAATAARYFKDIAAAG